ncbi:MAG: four helix bundle protein [Bacteroidia bacterium]
MKTENVIQEKSYAFALRIVKLYRYLTEKKNEYLLSKQVLRSGTSIGANVEEGIGGQSEKDFFAKLNIAYKEARETHYWLRILRDTNYLSSKESKAIIDDCNETLKIITAIINTMKKKFNY